MTRITKGASDHFGSAVVTVKAGLGHHDAQRLVHGAGTGRFPINATLFLNRFESCLLYTSDAADE